MINTSKRSKNNSTRDMAWSMAILLFIESFIPSFVQASQLSFHRNVGLFEFNEVEPLKQKLKTQNQSEKESNNADVFVDLKTTESSLVPGGPDQPEVQSFTPIGTSDMVNPFTGDFSYNIPIMDVDGYPINLAYSAGITMDQEASWVGLGWNLNPGVVNRSMRGLPDDFDGTDKISKVYNMKKNWTICFFFIN